MFELPAITWTLTVVLLFNGGYQLLQALRTRQLTDQINNVLHALMNLLMVAMLWNVMASTVLIQILVLFGAALWFVFQAIARPESKLFCAGSQSRLKCAYHSLAMAGAALMLVMMAHMTTAGHGSVTADEMSEMSMAHDHHAMAGPPQDIGAPAFDPLPDMAILLTGFFGAVAIVFIILLLRFRGRKRARHNTTQLRSFAGAEHGLEALGATAMALMFASMGG